MYLVTLMLSTIHNKPRALVVILAKSEITIIRKGRQVRHLLKLFPCVYYIDTTKAAAFAWLSLFDPKKK